MTYVMSDLHGNKEGFFSMLEAIPIKAEDSLYILGDVIDRNDGGIEILREIMKRKNTMMLLGNHELMLLEALSPDGKDDIDDEALYRWLLNGGDPTYAAMVEMTVEEQSEIIEYIKSLPVSYEISVCSQRFGLVHASPPELFLSDGSSRFSDATRYAVWYRMQGDDFARLPEDRITIFGHTPTTLYQPCHTTLKIWRGQNAIGVDCGAGFTKYDEERTGYRGRAACLRLEDMQELYWDNGRLVME